MRSVFSAELESFNEIEGGWRWWVKVWLPAVLAVLVIAIESTGTFSAENTSGWLRPLYEKLFGAISDPGWELLHHYIRKTGHFTGYGLVSLCFFHGFRTTLRAAHGLRRLWMRSSIFAIGCTVLLASADELHQAVLPMRGSSPLDVALDTCGAILAQLIILAVLAGRHGASITGSYAAE